MTTYTTSRTLADATTAQRLPTTTTLPGEPGWDAARQAWNLAVDQHPAAVVSPRTNDDIAATLRLAADHGLRVVTQGTGHAAAGYESLDDTILIRTAHLREVAIAGTRCRVGAGVLWGEVAEAAGTRGLAGLGGSSPDVGVVGYTLGGGIGWLSRPLGLASNAVTAIDIVLADGSAHRVDRQTMPDLFWALRGGGGGLGVVTSIEFELFAVPTVFGGTLAWDARHAESVVTEWAAWTHDLDSSITSIIRFLNLPDVEGVPDVVRGRRMLTLGIAATGDVDRAEHAVEVMRRVVRPELDTVAVMPSSALCRLHGDPEQPTAGAAHHRLLGAFGDEAIATLVDVAGAGSATSLVSVEVRHLGGALADAPAGAGALSHIGAPYVLNAVGTAHTDEASSSTRRDLDRVIDAMAPWQAGEYLNFVERPSEGVFPESVALRLREIKESVDPQGVFTLRSGVGAGR